MKRIITLLILCMLGISLIGCSNSDINSKNATNTSNVKGQNSDKKTYCDDDFIKDIYDLTNDSESDEYSTNTDFDKLSPEEQEKIVKEQIVSSIQDKIDKLEKYKKLEFENKELEKLSSKYIDLLCTKKGLIENGKNERTNSNGQKLEGYPSYAWLQCEYQECGLILEFANYYDLNMSDARKKDLENILQNKLDKVCTLKFKTPYQNNVLLFKQNDFDATLFFNIIEKQCDKNICINSFSQLKQELSKETYRLILLDYELIKFDLEQMRNLLSAYKKQHPQSHIIFFSKEKVRDFDCVSEVLSDVSRNDLITLLRKYLPKA